MPFSPAAPASLRPFNFVLPYFPFWMSNEKRAQQVWLGDGPWAKLQVHGTLHVQASLRSPAIRQGVLAASMAAALASVGASSNPPRMSPFSVTTCLNFM